MRLDLNSTDEALDKLAHSMYNQPYQSLSSFAQTAVKVRYTQTHGADLDTKSTKLSDREARLQERNAELEEELKEKDIQIEVLEREVEDLLEKLGE